METPCPIARFVSPCRVWAIGSVRGDAARLAALHAELGPRLEPDDRLIYLGSVIGWGAEVRETVDELLRFRRAFLAFANNCTGDYAVLRGSQEEMWTKLQEIQFAASPGEVLRWMAKQGVMATIAAYGGAITDGEAAANDGPLALAKWTSSLRAAVDGAPGHRDFLSSLKHAAYTADAGMMFVQAGVDNGRPLDAQGDTLWWDAASFDRLDKPFFDAKRVVRGYDPERRGVVETPYSVSVDAGCGFGGALAAVRLDADGTIMDTLMA